MYRLFYWKYLLVEALKLAEGYACRAPCDEINQVNKKYKALIHLVI